MKMQRMAKYSVKNCIFLQKCLVKSYFMLTFVSLVPAKPLIDAQMRGAFLFIDMSNAYKEVYLSKTHHLFANRSYTAYSGRYPFTVLSGWACSVLCIVRALENYVTDPHECNAISAR